jgi:hypothetical protein
MKRPILFSAITLLLFAAVPVYAEKPLNTTAGVGVGSAISASDIKPTPEMWFYDQAMREYKDPQMAVRTQAEIRSSQRQRRIESMKWFGLSNSRPHASSDPYHNDYSPHWVSNPGFYPSRWNGVTQQ